MRILQINNFHYMRGGADAIYLKTAKLLEEHGHSIVFFSMHHPDNLPCETSEFFMPNVDLKARYGIIDQIKIAGRLLYSFEARRRLSMLLDRYPVDIAHLHNIYHDLSPSILHELRKRKIPVVMTLHDPKLVCGSHNVYIDDKPCDVCSGGRHYMAIIKKCVKDSYAKSILIAFEMYLHQRILKIYDNVDVFTFPSLFFKSKFREMGFKGEGIHLPSFVEIKDLLEFETQGVAMNSNGFSYIIYVGKHLFDKGLGTLLDAAKKLSDEKADIEVKLSGDGPISDQLREKVKAEGINNVKFLGRIPYEELCLEMKNSLAVVLPSENYENNPVSIIEAFALGKPVIGSRLGGIPELVKDHERGLTFDPGDPGDFSSKIKYLRNNPDEAEKMGNKAKAYIMHELDAERYYQKLMEIYKLAKEKRMRD